MYDRNPKYGADQSFSEGAKRVGDLLWETTGGNLTSAPISYLQSLRHEYSDGRVSMLELMDRVDLGPDATYEDYCEVFDALLSVDPSRWPEPENVVSVHTDRLLHEVETDFSEFNEEEWEFAEGDMSSKVETFLKKVISSVYTDGVSDITDSEGNPPSESNSYLMSDDGNSFSGIFYDRGSEGDSKSFPFQIMQKGGKWSISY